MDNLKEKAGTDQSFSVRSPASAEDSLIYRSELVARSTDLVRRASPAAFALWFGTGKGHALNSAPMQDHADIIYTASLLGIADQLNPAVARDYQALLAGSRLYGRPAGTAIATKGLNAHLTALLMGAARLLHIAGIAAMQPALFRGWQIDQMIDARQVPRWPGAWTHHSWRVSHWIGGTPSILLQIADSGHNPQITHALVADVLASAARHVIDPVTGLLRPYRSALLHRLFKSAYRLRHDPELGELGGVVHILWVFHALDTPYLARDALYANAWKQLQATPFMEAAPFCLDFDILQLARTAGPQANTAPLTGRATRMRQDIAAFLTAPLPASYTLHKLPGALATMHECAMIEGLPEVPELGIAPIDIIRQAYWI